MPAIPKIVKMEATDIYDGKLLKFFIINDGDEPLFSGDLRGSVKHKDGTIGSFMESVSIPDGGLMKGQMAKSIGYTTTGSERKDAEILINIDSYVCIKTGKGNQFPLDATVTPVSSFPRNSWRIDGKYVTENKQNSGSFFKNIMIAVMALAVFILVMSGTLKSFF